MGVHLRPWKQEISLLSITAVVAHRTPISPRLPNRRGHSIRYDLASAHERSGTFIQALQSTHWLLWQSHPLVRLSLGSTPQL